MGDRALTILAIAALQPNSKARETKWRQLCEDRTEAATLALLRDAVKRRRVTVDDYRTMQLTDDGRLRKAAGESQAKRDA